MNTADPARLDRRIPVARRTPVARRIRIDGRILLDRRIRLDHRIRLDRGIRFGPTRLGAAGRTGFTLLETVISLLVLGVLLAVTMPPFARWRDVSAVHAARDELAAGFAWTRIAASSRNGATLVLDAAEGRFWTVASGGTAAPAADLRSRYRVHVEAGGAGPVLFHYDALGIGRLASRTIRIRRREAEAGLTVSAYGRVRRW